jgi:hypothetical protein
MLFFEFPEDARWNDDRDAVEFSVILRPYEGTVRSAGGSSRVYSISAQHRSVVSRRSISSGRGSR